MIAIARRHIKGVKIVDSADRQPGRPESSSLGKPGISRFQIKCFVKIKVRVACETFLMIIRTFRLIENFS